MFEACSCVTCDGHWVFFNPSAYVPGTVTFNDVVCERAETAKDAADALAAIIKRGVFASWPAGVFICSTDPKVIPPKIR